MSDREPTAELQPEFSSPGAAPIPWTEARRQLEQAQMFWLSTVRPDGRPHVTPLVAVSLDDTLYFCTGENERKARNLAGNTHCAITTGCNTLADGLDLMLEGDAVRVSDRATLERVSAGFAAKYDPIFHFTVGDGVLLNSGDGEALVYAVRPATAFGFGKGATFSQTRWRF